MSKRTDQISENIKIKLSEIIIKEIEMKDGDILSISQISISPDLKNAKVIISVWPQTSQLKVLQKLRDKAKHLRHELAQIIEMRAIPNLYFSLEKKEDNNFEMDRLFDEIKKDLI